MRSVDYAGSLISLWEQPNLVKLFQFIAILNTSEECNLIHLSNIQYLQWSAKLVASHSNTHSSMDITRLFCFQLAHTHLVATSPIQHTHIPRCHTTDTEISLKRFKYLHYSPSATPWLARAVHGRILSPPSGSLMSLLHFVQLTRKVERSIESRLLILTDNSLFGTARQPS